MIGSLVRLALPFDTYERHTVVSRLVGASRTVLDVGGRRGELALFLRNAEVTAVNVDEPADVLFDGSALPFPDGSFDAVTSIDVLEHLPRERRKAHLVELVRVARSRVVACCPLGTPAHVEAERDLARRYPHPFLKEHLANRLPTEEGLRELVSSLPLRFELRFHGDFRVANELFALGMEARALRPRAVLAYATRRARWQPNVALDAESTPFTNRLFLLGGPVSRP